MAEATVAPAPPGVQTYAQSLGPKSAKSERAGKFAKAFAELTQADVQPQEEATPPQKPLDPAEPPPVVPKEESKTELSKPDESVAIGKKPESPLDAVLAKTPVKEREKVEEPDVLKEFDEKTANWQRAREVMKTQSGELKTLREENKALKTSPKVEPSVIEELTKQRDEFKTKFQQQEEKLKGLNYTFSDEFQNLVAARETDVAKLAERVTAFGGDAKAILAALSLPESRVRSDQIDEALNAVGDKNRGRIDRLIERIEEHDEKISDAQKDSPKRWEQLQAQREAQLAEQSQAALKQLDAEFSKIVETIPDNTVTLREVADDVPGATEWNAAIRQARENGLKALKPGGADLKTSVEIAVKGYRYDSLEKWALGIYSDYKELQKVHNEAVGSGPDFKGGTKATPDVPKKPGLKFREALAIARGEAGGEM